MTRLLKPLKPRLARDEFRDALSFGADMLNILQYWNAVECRKHSVRADSPIDDVTQYENSLQYHIADAAFLRIKTPLIKGYHLRLGATDAFGTPFDRFMPDMSGLTPYRNIAALRKQLQKEYLYNAIGYVTPQTSDPLRGKYDGNVLHDTILHVHDTTKTQKRNVETITDRSPTGRTIMSLTGISVSLWLRDSADDKLLPFLEQITTLLEYDTELQHLSKNALDRVVQIFLLLSAYRAQADFHDDTPIQWREPAILASMFDAERNAITWVDSKTVVHSTEIRRYALGALGLAPRWLRW